MVLQVFKYTNLLFFLAFVFCDCKTQRNDNFNREKIITKANRDIIKVNNTERIVINNDYSIIVYRLFIDGKLIDKKFNSNCIKNDEKRYFKNYYGRFEYGDLLVAACAIPVFDGRDFWWRNTFSIVHENKRMTVKIDKKDIQNHFYIDSLIFKEGDYHLIVENKTHETVSLKNKFKQFEEWKPSDGLITKECISGDKILKVVDRISKKNLIQDISYLKYYKIYNIDIISSIEYDRRKKSKKND